MTQDKDWTGDKNSIFKCLGANSHCEHDYEKNAFYATDPKAGEMLLELMPQLDNIWENACGIGHLAKVFEDHNKLGLATDLIDRGYYPNVSYRYGEDFLMIQNKWNGDIATNPPYSMALDFCKHSIELIQEGRYVCMFLKIQFLEGKERKKFFENNPPKYIYVSSSRIKCAMNGDFSNISSSAVCYAWFVWQKGFKGEPIVRWFN